MPNPLTSLILSDQGIDEYVAAYGLEGLFSASPKGDVPINHSVDPSVTEPYAPEWDDLVRLHRLIRERKVTTILEFGCGYSTVVMAHALQMNQVEHGEYVATNLRRNNAYQIHAIDDIPAYVESTRERVPAELVDHVTIYDTLVRMTTFNGRIATEYDSLPNVCPDFIYLDGPSQHSVLGAVNGISTTHRDRLPMSCDILRIEHFLLPGTLVLVDGRTANARFLTANLQREWRSEHDEASDVTWLELVEPPLGRFNRRQLEFCLGADWEGLTAE